MQAKSICDVSAKPAVLLEELNLGESVPLLSEEQRAYRVHDGQGRVVRDVFGSPEGSRSLLLLRDGKCNPTLGETEDAGSMLDGWSEKCLMNAVLQVAPAEMRPTMRSHFLVLCGNNVGSGRLPFWRHRVCVCVFGVCRVLKTLRMAMWCLVVI